MTNDPSGTSLACAYGRRLATGRPPQEGANIGVGSHFGLEAMFHVVGDARTIFKRRCKIHIDPVRLVQSYEGFAVRQRGTFQAPLEPSFSPVGRRGSATSLPDFIPDTIH